MTTVNVTRKHRNELEYYPKGDTNLTLCSFTGWDKTPKSFKEPIGVLDNDAKIILNSLFGGYYFDTADLVFGNNCKLLIYLTDSRNSVIVKITLSTYYSQFVELEEPKVFFERLYESLFAEGYKYTIYTDIVDDHITEYLDAAIGYCLQKLVLFSINNTKLY